MTATGAGMALKATGTARKLKIQLSSYKDGSIVELKQKWLSCLITLYLSSPVAAVPSLLSCPGCPVLSVLPRLTVRPICPDWSVSAILSKLLCPRFPLWNVLSWPATVVPSQLLCPSWLVLAVMFRPSSPLLHVLAVLFCVLYGCPGYPVQAVLFRLSFHSCSVSVVLPQHSCSQLSCRPCLSLLSCPGNPVFTFLHRMTCQGWLVMADLLDGPVRTQAVVVLSSLSCHGSQLSWPSCPAPAPFSTALLPPPPVVSLLLCPYCPILPMRTCPSDLSGWPVQTDLSRLSCSQFVSQRSCPRWTVMASLSLISRRYLILQY